MNKKFTKLIAALALLVFMMPSMAGWGQSMTYNFSSIPTSGWSTSGGSQTINGVSWTYSSSTYIGNQSSRIQVGSGNNPQTTAWTIQTPITSFGANKKITAVSITANTTNTTATYDISAGGSSVKSGSLTTSSATYSVDGLSVTSGNVVVTMTGSSTSKAMYLSNISVTYEAVAVNSYNVTLPAEDTYGTYTMDKINPVDENTTVTLTYTPKTGYENYIARWSVGGEAIAGNTFTMPSNDVTVTVNLMECEIDVLNCAWTGVTSGYTAWSGKEGSASDAVYAGNSSNGNSAIQLRTANSTSGIVTTISGGKAQKITVSWNSNTSNGRTLDIYGKNEAYSSASDLYAYSAATKGTLLGSITYGVGTELLISGDYKYIGLRSNNDAMYLDEIDIAWQPNAVKAPTFTVAGGTYPGTQAVGIECVTPNVEIYYTLDGSVPSASSTAYTSGTTITISETKTLKAIAINGEESSSVASATYTIIPPLTTMQAIYDKATAVGSTQTNVFITFDNWVVSGANNSYAFITDGTKGCMIYNTPSGEHGGFSVGDILSGTVWCGISLYTNSARLYLTNEADGLTVNTGGTLSVANIAMTDLSGVNTGALISYDELTCTNASSNNYTVSDGTTTLKAHTALFTYSSSSFTKNKKYDISGIYYQNGTTKSFCPRSTADIVLKAQMTPPTFSAFITSTSSPSAAQSQTISGTDFNGALIVTAPTHFEVSSDGTTWGATATYTPNGSKVVSGTLYVRLKTGLATGTYEENLTFTATNLNEKTTALNGTVKAYAINIDGEIENGTVEANAYFANADETIELTITPASCYQLKTLTVLDGNAVDVDVNENYQFTMPGSNVEIDAEFEMSTYTVNYSVNGTIETLLQETVNCGNNAPLHSASDLDGIVELPDGYTFAGWSTSASSTTTIDELTPSENTTLYAVLAHSEYGTPVTVYQKVQSEPSDWEGMYLVVNESDSKVLNGGASDIAAATAAVDVSIESNMIESNQTTDGYSFVVTSYSGGYSFKTTNNTYMGRTEGTSGGANATSANPVKNTLVYSNGDVAITTTNGTTTYHLRYNNNNTTVFRYYTSASQNAVQLYKKTTITPTTTTYYIRVIEYAGNNNSIETVTPADLITVPAGAVLTITGACTGGPENLIIKDGGQLKVYTTGAKDGGVQATVEKYIGKYTADDNGWNFIASPLTSAFAPDATMTSNTYDLYQLNNTKWENYKDNEGHTNANPGFSLENGHGYLYANSENVTLSFPGAVKPFNTVDPTANQVPVSAGWNLIGNPYTFNVYVNQAYYTISQAQEGITAQTTANNTDAIAPCTSVLVNVEGSGDVTFYETAPSTSNNGNLNLIVAQAATNRGTAANLDNAIVSFNEGSQLEKFYFGSPKANIYIPQGNEEYAIVNAEAQGEMPVSFRANENGQYTLTVNAENVEMNYLHLIDNMTGADIDLLQTPSYTFNAKTYDYESRFRLVFAANNEDGSSTGSETFSFYSNGNLIINNEGNATLQVIDALGRILSNEGISGTVSKSIDAPAGVYVLRLINGENVKTQKIVVR